jgi:hypothetical protein
MDVGNGYAYNEPIPVGGVMGDELEQDLERQIGMTHDRFTAAMNGRVPTMTLEQKERYFAVLSGLVVRLEDADKPLRVVLQEMMAEAAPYLFREMNG